MKKYERTDSLGKDHVIVVSSAHTFGTDAVLLSSFAGLKPKEKAVDLGTGCGVIPLLWCKNKTNEIYAVDIQERACRQLEKSIELNGFNGRIKVVNHDLRQIGGVLPRAYFDLVTMNPPYKPVGTGIESELQSDKTARFETECTIADTAECAAGLLRFGGRFCLCHRPERLADVICALRACRLEPKRIRFVSKRENTEPWLVLVESRFGGKPSLKVEPNLIMYGAGGELSEEVKKLFGDYYID